MDANPAHRRPAAKVLLRRAALVVAVLIAVLAAAVATTAAARPDGPGGRLAVVAGGGLEVISPRTGSRRELATVVMSAPAWSADGRELAYVRGGAFSTSVSLRVRNTGSGRERVVARLGDGFSAGPAWAPRGGLIALTVDSSDGTRLIVVDRYGRHRRVVERNAAQFQVPQWSPDGQRIAYFRNVGEDGESSIWSIQPNGKGRRMIRSGVLDYPNTVSWSPDGSRIAFVAASGEGAALMTANANGTGTRMVAGVPAAAAEASAGHVSWSPGGRWVAFVRWHTDPEGRRTSSELCLADARGGGEKVLLRAPYIDELAWSPDGRWLAYLAENLSATRLMTRVSLVRADGSGNRTLVRLGDEASGLAWSRVRRR